MLVKKVLNLLSEIRKFSREYEYTVMITIEHEIATATFSAKAELLSSFFVIGLFLSILGQDSLAVAGCSSCCYEGIFNFFLFQSTFRFSALSLAKFERDF